MTITWEEFQKLRGHEKVPYFERGGRIFHVIMAQQFDRAFLDRICALATKIRGIAKSATGMRFLKGLLDTKAAMLYFAQPSTRTRISFQRACQILGMDTILVTDTSTSSEAKGETPEDSIRTFSSYVDLIIMRHHLEGLAERMALMMNFIGRPVPIINGGSGKDQHPTQALLDIYTLHRSFENYGGIEGKIIAMVGDVLRSRVVRSLSYLMKHYPGVRLISVAPLQLRMADDIKEYLRENGVPFEEINSLREVIPVADAFYMTRVQDEHDKKPGESTAICYDDFSFKAEYLDEMKPNAIIMHPLPRRQEIPVEIDGDKKAVFWRQGRNGMWTRVGLVAIVFEVDGKIMDY